MSPRDQTSSTTVDEIDDALMTMTVANPRTASFIPIARQCDGHFDRDGLINAVTHGFRIVRWHLDTPTESPTRHVVS